jgi:hypothetical protein
VGALPEFLLGSLGCIAPLNDPAAFANAMKAKADPILNGQVTSAEIQTAYVSRFPRRQVIDKYLQVFGCLESTEQKVQTV